jgi:Protein of unknown function (DUF3370)
MSALKPQKYRRLIVYFVLLLLPIFTTVVTAQTSQEILQPQEVRSLPGKLDRIPVFNSNSPELVLKEGILLSTFPSENKTHTNAHLNYPLAGYFDIFAHHIAKAPNENDIRTLYLGILFNNPNSQPVNIDILQSATYVSQPDAPFIELPAQVDNPDGNIYAGPGSRVMDDILRDRRSPFFPRKLVIPPNSSQMLLNLPIPVSLLEPPINGRSTYIRLKSDGKIYAASLAKFAFTDADGNESIPTLAQWQELLNTGDLAAPRDKTPTPPNGSGSIIYGRVAGISLGSRWQATIGDNSDSSSLTIPESGKAFSYPISSLDGGTLGTNQIQSAPMVVRYPDTAYKAHGNYGVQYSLTLPLQNPTGDDRNVTIALQTPIKQDKIDGGLRFFDPLPKPVFFRGTVKVAYQDDNSQQQEKYFHLVQKRGQRGDSLVTLNLSPQEQRTVKVDFLYPPDATPPQVLTIATN